MARYERIIKTLITVILVISLTFVGYVCFDRWQDGQWEDVEYTTQTNEQDGNAIITQGDVEIG